MDFKKEYNFKDHRFDNSSGWGNSWDSFLDQLWEETVNRKIANPNPDEWIAPLKEVFLPNEIMNGVLEDIWIAYAMSWALCARPWVILCWPPGTWKSELWKAIVQAYANLWAYSSELSITSMQSMWMWQYPKLLEKEIEKAKAEAKKRWVNSVLFFDEADILVESPEWITGNTRYYQEGINVLKRHLEWEASSWVTIIVNTNAKEEDFNDAITRTWRLSTYEILPPKLPERMKLWNHFLRKFNIFNPSEEQLQILSEEFESLTWADIYWFCERFFSSKKTRDITARYNGALLDALLDNQHHKISWVPYFDTEKLEELLWWTLSKWDIQSRYWGLSFDKIFDWNNKKNEQAWLSFEWLMQHIRGFTKGLKRDENSWKLWGTWKVWFHPPSK